MTQEKILEVDHVSMEFNLEKEKVDNIKEYVIRRLKNQLWNESFYALRDISFSLMKGESLALVGLNGSGKSTLLKVIAGVLKPTKGNVSVNGSIAPLIELGAGFDMDLTAKENVWLSGAMLGCGRKKMREYYEDIVSFSELSEFMDVPLKNFSSGMLARLAFSIATFRTPRLLIVDEVLSVGDFRFQEKCDRRIAVIKEQGASVLFVSHSMDQVRQTCEKAVWLKDGQMKMIGETEEVIRSYQEDGTDGK